MIEASCMIPERLAEPIDSVVPSGITHIGFVPTNANGDFLITEPKGHPYGVSATFSKLKAQTGERPSETLERCLRDQVGMEPEGVYPIPVVWSTANSAGFYFAGMVRPDAVESPPNLSGHTRWCNLREAEHRIGVSQNQESKRRDLGLLATASAMCLFPCRRILLMLRELHHLGFERLRAPAYMYPLAWRCPIVPAYWTHKRHGGTFEEPFSQIEQLFGIPPCQYQYSSADRQFPFGWEDVAFATPSDLARRFVRDRREIASAGWGPDADYARWFEEALESTKPNGLYYAFEEFQDVTNHLYTCVTKVESVPLPPPGWATEGEFARHTKDVSEETDGAISEAGEP